MTDEPKQELCELIHRIAAAVRDGDDALLNASLYELAARNEAYFRKRVERRLESYREASGGYSVTLEDAGDVLAETLTAVYQKASTFRGTTDAEAYAWLRTIVDRRTFDALRVAVRRVKKLRGVFESASKKLKDYLSVWLV